MGTVTLMKFLGLAGMVALSSLAVAPTNGATAQQLIAALKMQLIPGEGAWFAPTYSSSETIEGPAASHVSGSHRAYSAIYALETPKDFSALHRLATDEMWHFYGGVPIEMLLLYPDGHGETVVIGADVLAGQKPQFLVPRGVWQGSRPLAVGETPYSFFGTTLTPGFEYSDYEQGYRDELTARYPAFAAQIAALTRDDSLHKPGSATASKAAPPPLELQEIVGRTAAAHSERVSVAFFRLQPGAASALSYNHVGEEIFIISAGHGGVLRGATRTAVSRGSVIYVDPRVVRSVRADEGEVLEFYAVTAPAWSPEDDVHVAR
jgi:predicted cupin superfamily sugar epimerase/mannose-6-phosphate isomerase-like protein (cupin superfamily)